MKSLIAIDFDDTITTHSPYPQMGEIREDAKYYIQKLYTDGYTLILWTCRTGFYLAEAIKALQDADIFDFFQYVNEDGIHDKFGRRKIIAAFYIDDKSCFGEIDWKKTYEYIKSNIKVEF